MSAFAARFQSLNRQRSQRLMFISIFAFVTILSIGTLAMAARSGTLGPWLAFRLFIGEFLIAWLAADHVTGTLARARKTNEWRDWRLFPDAAADIVQGLVTTTRSLLWTGIAIWAIIEIPMTISILRSSDQLVPVLSFLLAFHALLVAAVVHYAPAFIAAYARADGRMGRAWARCALQLFLASFLLALLAAGIVIGVLGTSIFPPRYAGVHFGLFLTSLLLIRLTRQKLQLKEANTALRQFLESAPSP